MSNGRVNLKRTLQIAFSGVIMLMCILVALSYRHNFRWRSTAGLPRRMPDLPAGQPFLELELRGGIGYIWLAQGFTREDGRWGRDEYKAFGASMLVRREPDRRFITATIPLWATIPPVGAFVLFRLYRRLSGSGNAESEIPCAECRYDLTGNTSGICPECGTPITPSQKVSLPLAEDRSTTPGT